MSRLRAAIYTRISQKDAKVPKVENQEIDCRKLALASGYKVVRVFTDDGLSGYKIDLDRPGFVALQAFIEAGACDVVIATADDRFTRGGGIESLKFSALCADNDVKMHTGREGLQSDDEDTAELLTFLNGWKAKREVKDNIRRRKDANAKLREAGRAPKTGPRPFGWNEDRVTVNEAEAELIRSGTAAILDGKSLNSVVAGWRASGLTPSRASAWPRVTVSKTLCRWRNAGVMSFMDEPSDVPVEWEAITTRSEVEQVRAILSAKGTGKRTPSRPLSGVIRCACGESMVASGANGKPTYQCSARLRGLAVPGETHSAIMAHVVEPSVIDAVIGRFRYRQDDPTPDAEAERLADLIKQRDDLRGERARVQEGWVGKLFTLPEATTKAAQIDAKTQTVQALINTLVSASASARLAAETMREVQAFEFGDMNRHDLWDKFREIFANIPIDEARNLIAATLSVTVHPGRGPERIEIDLTEKPQPVVSTVGRFERPEVTGGYDKTVEQFGRGFEDEA